MITNEKHQPKKNQVLIVDDIPSNLNFLSEVLHREGIGILLATNGTDAIEIARQKLPALILLDIAMPGMDGYEVCATLKEDPLTRDIAVIYLTARTEPEDILRGFESGAADYILKPFNSTELIARVRTQLELKEKTEALKSLNAQLEDQVRQRTMELTISNESLREANIKLEQAYNELSTLEQAKDEFIRHINHELRTPLQGIHGFTLILEEIVNSPEQKEYIQAINSLVKRLVKLSEITLIITEIKANNHKVNLKTVPVQETLELLMEEFRTSAGRIEVEQDKFEKLDVRADQKLLLVTLEQILDNALKYTPEDKKIIISTFRKNENVTIEVADKGPGFSNHALDHLFEFFTADNLKYRSHGFGIGLATAKTILNTMNARLDINNIPDQGAVVSISFPV